MKKFFLLICSGCGHEWNLEVVPESHNNIIGGAVLDFVTHVSKSHSHREHAVLEIVDQCHVGVILTGKLGEHQCELSEGHGGPHRISWTA